MRFRQQTAEQVAGVRRPGLSANAGPDLRRAVCIPSVLQQDLNLAGSERAVVFLARHAASHSQPGKTRRMVRLIVAVMNYQHGPPCPHRLARGTDATLVHHHAATGEDSIVRSILDSDHSRRQLAFRLVPRIVSNKEYGAAAQPVRRLGAVLKEISSYANRRRPQGENDGWFSGVEKALELGRIPLAMFEERKAGGMCMGRPIGLRSSQQW
jgi:hypothetical protein